ncbi:hypothetical protein I4F81_003505 [Pyropia yezoensis]|uniref:Uncharacterized protein n=1 Tax=Pyropia yezoensis TaxID=2788 RepID=A0ACC3BT86_PYRYE|nr:hypothetical protein I4F81_003505 [Neopyropia yezoensis]
MALLTPPPFPPPSQRAQADRWGGGGGINGGGGGGRNSGGRRDAAPRCGGGGRCSGHHATAAMVGWRPTACRGSRPIGWLLLAFAAVGVATVRAAAAGGQPPAVTPPSFIVPPGAPVTAADWDVPPPLLPLTMRPADDAADGSDHATGDWPSNVTRLTEMIEVWTHAALPPDARLCRIHGACRVGDGTFLLPSWMKAFHSTVLRCGVGAPQYLLKAAPDGTYAVDAAYGRRIVLTDAHNGTDLFGVDPPGETMPAIATDLTPVLLLMDVLERMPAHAARLTRDRITMQKDEKWVKGFLRLIRNAFYGAFTVLDAADLYGWKVRGVAACARSVVTTGLAADALPDGLFPADHFLYAANQISRAPRRTGADVATALAATARACTVRVMVLNRVLQCAGYQRLTFNVKAVAALAVSRGLAHCGVDRPPAVAAPISATTAQGMA